MMVKLHYEYRLLHPCLAAPPPPPRARDIGHKTLCPVPNVAGKASVGKAGKLFARSRVRPRMATWQVVRGTRYRRIYGRLSRKDCIRFAIMANNH